MNTPNLLFRFSLIFSFFIYFTAFSSFAQNKTSGNATLSGNILDSASQNPIESATVSLLAAVSKRQIAGASSDSKGNFELKGITAGHYLLNIESIGYQARKQFPVFIAGQNETLKAGTFYLKKKSETLQDVTVVARKGLIENKIDKMVFNAEKDISSQSGVATDLLKKVPQISVDVDGNVELAGSSSIKFLINGKPSTIFGNNIADVLQSIPASQIKSIEVITNPGAKYDAEGLGGVINIILKKNNARGVNGNLSLSAGSLLQNGSFNLNARNGNFGANAFLSGNAKLSANTPSQSERFGYDSASNTEIDLLQNGVNRYKRHGFQTGFGLDWKYRKHNDFTGNFSYNDFGNSSQGTINQLQNSISNGGSGSIVSAIPSLNLTNSKFNFYNYDYGLNYRRTFDKEDQELDISFNSSFGHNTINAGNEQYLLPKDSLSYSTINTNPGQERETEIQIDYTQPLPKNMELGFGGKMSLRDVSGNSIVYANQQAMADSNLSNSIDYHQKVFAGYGEFKFQLFKWLDVKTGARYERTVLNAYFSNVAQPTDLPSYNSLVPSAYLAHKLNESSSVRFSYSRRIQRPEYSDLNPFINTTDPKNLSAGNPHLQPEIGNRIELAYSKDLASLGSFLVSLFYRTSNHDIQPYTVYYAQLPIGDTVYTNVAYSTRQNIGLEKNLGSNLFADIHLNQKLDLRANIFLFYRQTINALNPGYNASSFNYRFNLNASYQFPHNLAAEFFGNFNSARNEVQGRYPSYTSYSMAFRKLFWNKKGSVALTANNFLSEYVNQRTSISGPGFSLNSLRQVPYRSIGLNFTWKFGVLEFKEKKEDNSGSNQPVE